MIRDVLLEEINASMNGKPRKMTRLEAVVGAQVISALKGNVPSAKVVLALAKEHVPDRLTLEELLGNRPVFEWSEAEMARLTKKAVLEHINQEPDKPSGEGTNEQKDSARGDAEDVAI
jgi:hypothetical protein